MSEINYGAITDLFAKGSSTATKDFSVTSQGITESVKKGDLLLTSGIDVWGAPTIDGGEKVIDQSEHIQSVSAYSKRIYEQLPCKVDLLNPDTTASITEQQLQALILAIGPFVRIREGDEIKSLENQMSHVGPYERNEKAHELILGILSGLGACTRNADAVRNGTSSKDEKSRVFGEISKVQLELLGYLTGVKAIGEIKDGSSNEGDKKIFVLLQTAGRNLLDCKTVMKQGDVKYLSNEQIQKALQSQDIVLSQLHASPTQRTNVQLNPPTGSPHW